MDPDEHIWKIVAAFFVPVACYCSFATWCASSKEMQNAKAREAEAVLKLEELRRK